MMMYYTKMRWNDKAWSILEISGPRKPRWIQTMEEKHCEKRSFELFKERAENYEQLVHKHKWNDVTMDVDQVED